MHHSSLECFPLSGAEILVLSFSFAYTGSALAVLHLLFYLLYVIVNLLL